MNSLNKIIIYFIIFLQVIIITPYIYCTTYYVNNTGSDSYTGLSASVPWKTIQHAVNSMSSGDICIIYPGIYNRVIINRNGSAGNLITLKGLNTPNKSDSSNNTIVKGFDITGQYFRIENFDITNIGTGAGAFNIDNANGIEIYNNYIHQLDCEENKDSGVRVRTSGNNISVVNNTFYKVEGISIYIVGTNWLVEGNNISRGTTLRPSDGLIVVNDTDAMRFFGHSHTIRNNFIHDYLLSESLGDPHMDAFQTYYVSGTETYDITIESNICINLGTQIIMITNLSGMNAVHDITIRNNILDTCGSYALNIKYVENLKIQNNIIANATLGSLILENCGNAKVVNNIFYKNTYGPELKDDYTKNNLDIFDYNLHYPNFTWPLKYSVYGSNEIYGQNPGFESPDTKNYKLVSGSKAIDKGLVQYEFDNDIEGNKRIYGSSWDIGPYEFVSTVYPKPIKIRVKN